jgi:hypothetical protein
MPRAPARFTQADIARAIRAVEQARVRATVEVTRDGVIRIVPLDAAPVDHGENAAPAVAHAEEIVL